MQGARPVQATACGFVRWLSCRRVRRLQIGPERQQRDVFMRMMLKECIDPAATEVGVRRRKKGAGWGVEQVE